MKTIASLILTIFSLNAMADKLDLRNIELPVKRTEYKVNPDTGIWEGESKYLKDQEIKEIISSMQLKHAWMEKTGKFSFLKALDTLAGGERSGGWDRTQKYRYISNKILSVKNDKVVFVPTKEETLVYSNSSYITFHTDYKNENFTFWLNAHEVSTMKEIEHITVERNLNKRLSHLLFDREFAKSPTYNSINTDTAYTDCEIGFNLSESEIKLLSKQLAEACGRSNYMDCSNVPTLTKNLARNIVVTVYERATDTMTSKLADRVIMSSVDNVSSKLSFLGRDGEILLDGNVDIFKGISLTHAICGTSHK